MSVVPSSLPDAKLKRVEEFISFLGGGELGDALMSLVVAYQQRGVKIDHLKEKLSRTLEQQQEERP